MKRSIIIGVMILFLIGVTGCGDNKNNNGTSKMVHEHCTREGSIDDGEVSLSYEIYYTGEKLNLLQADEMVISSNQSILDEYEQAYKQINENYKKLEYYDTKVIRTDTSVARTAVINYDKINIYHLLAIEGEEDNIVENGIAKVEKWKELAKKFGTTCTSVSVEK